MLFPRSLMFDIAFERLTRKIASSFISEGKHNRIYTTVVRHLPAACPKHLTVSRRYHNCQSKGRTKNCLALSHQDVENLTLKKIKKMKVVELKYELKKRDMPTSGLKEELVNRLIDSSQPSQNFSKISTDASQSNNKQELLSPSILYILRFHGECDYLDASASCGIVLYNSKTSKIEWEGRIYLQNGESAHEAEYIGLEQALQLLKISGVRKLVIQGNEKSTVLNQLRGKDNVVTKPLKQLNQYVQYFLREELEHVEIWGILSEQNGRARNLARKAAKTKSSHGFSSVRKSKIEPSGNESISNFYDTEGKYLGEFDENKLSSLGFLSKDGKNSPKNNNDFNSMKENQSNISLNLPILSPDKVYVLRFDGGSRGNPGSAGAGMVLFDFESQLEVWCAYKYLQRATNNIAEYQGLLEGLKFSKKMGAKNLIAEGDSKLVVNQINGTNQVKNEHLKILHQQALSLSNEFRSFRLKYIPRKENFRADQLANVAMDEKSSSNMLLDKESIGDKRLPLVMNRSDGAQQPESYICGKVKIDEARELPYPKLSGLLLQIHPNNVYCIKSCITSNQRENTHGAAFSMCTEDSGKKIWSGSYFIPEGVSSNAASYIAVIISLRCALELGVEKLYLEIKSDLIINQLNGKFKLKSKNLIHYHEVARKLIDKFSLFQITRLEDYNSEANLKYEARKAMENRLSKL